MRPIHLAGVGLVTASVAAALFVASRPPRGNAPTPSTGRSALTAVAAKPKRELTEFVAKNAKAADPKVQDLVGVARAQIAYSLAGKKDFKAARAQFLTAAREYKGTGAMSADWGGLPDQAAYQAAACLVADGKPVEAKAEFTRFLRERPLSPLVHAVHKRLVKMDPEREETYNDLLQAAISKQEAKIRFETSVCGPRVIAYLLDEGLINGPKTGYERLAKLCGTTDTGTSIAGMGKGLKALGIESYAYKLNRQDLAHAPLPAILLEGDHYVALLAVGAAEATVYDPRFKAKRAMPLPPADDPDFFATAILLRELEGRP